jgi:MFS family permease
VLATCLGATALLGTWGSVQWTPSWADKLARDELTALEATLEKFEQVQSDKPGGQQFSDKIMDETRAKIASERRRATFAKAWAQISASFGAIVGTVLAALLADWFSRRLAYFGLCLASLLSCAYLFRVPMHFDGQFLTLIFLVGGLTASFYGWLPLYLPELFPTRVRATGQGFAFNFGRVLAAAGTLGSGWLLNRFNEDYARMCSVISLIYVVGLVLIWYCPETKGKPLPE